MAKDISVNLEAGHLKEAEQLFLWLLKAAVTSTKGVEIYDPRKWDETHCVYNLLCETYSGIRDCEEYLKKAREAMFLFCRNCYTSLVTRPPNGRSQDSVDSLSNMDSAT